MRKILKNHLIKIKNSITFLNLSCLRQTSSVNLYEFFFVFSLNGFLGFLRFNCYFLKSRFRSIRLPLLPTSLQIFRRRQRARSLFYYAAFLHYAQAVPRDGEGAREQREERGGGVTSQDKWISSRFLVRRARDVKIPSQKCRYTLPTKSKVSGKLPN